MTLSRSSAKPRLTLLACALLLAGLGAILAAEPANTKREKSKNPTAADGLFTNGQVFQIEIEIPESGLDVLRDSPQRARGGAQKRPSVKAVVSDGENIYKDVAIHLKGAAGSFRSIDDRPALTLNFDKHVKGQTFRGLERFSLNNSVQDPSYLNEQITREMFAAAGVPVPRATHARVHLNGRDLGVYVLTEAFNKQFLARHFKNPNGNLYDGGFLKDITDDVEKSSGPNPEDRSDLARLAEAATATSSNRFARMSALLDVDRFLSLVAVDVLTCNWDGYALNKNNYRIYHDPDSDKIVFMPHGLDQMFGVMRVGTDMTIYPKMQGLVARALLATPEGRSGYRERLRQIMASVYDVPALTNRVWELAAKVRPQFDERGEARGRSYEQQVRALCRRIVARAQHIQEQLALPDRALKFDSAGSVRFTDWKPQADHGKPALKEITEDGRKLLHISAAGSAVGAWLVPTRLEPGRYRLVGKVKCRDVVPDPGDRRAGAGLRINGRRFDQKLVGNADWTDVVFDFELQDGGGGQFGFMGPIEDELPDVELRCELRAAKGEAWFDLESLRLLKR